MGHNIDRQVCKKERIEKIQFYSSVGKNWDEFWLLLALITFLQLKFGHFKIPWATFESSASQKKLPDAQNEVKRPF